jgi:hypothetical protein
MTYLLFSWPNLEDRGGMALRNVVKLLPDYRKIPEYDILNTDLFNRSKHLLFASKCNQIWKAEQYFGSGMQRNIRQIVVAASRGRTNSASEMDRPYKGNLSSQASEVLECSSHVREPNSEANKAKANVLKIPRGVKCLGTIRIRVFILWASQLWHRLVWKVGYRRF